MPKIQRIFCGLGAIRQEVLDRKNGGMFFQACIRGELCGKKGKLGALKT